MLRSEFAGQGGFDPSEHANVACRMTNLCESLYDTDEGCLCGKKADPKRSGHYVGWHCYATVKDNEFVAVWDPNQSNIYLSNEVVGSNREDLYRQMVLMHERRHLKITKALADQANGVLASTYGYGYAWGMGSINAAAKDARDALACAVGKLGRMVKSPSQLEGNDYNSVHDLYDDLAYGYLGNFLEDSFLSNDLFAIAQAALEACDYTGSGSQLESFRPERACDAP